MSKPLAVAWAETAEELEARYRAERDLARRKRLGALWLVRRGERVAEAGRLVGVGERTVFRWLGWYRQAGLAGMLRRVPGHGAVGAPHRLTAEEQQAILGRMGRGESRTYEEARAWVRSEFGGEYCPAGMYAALVRLGIRPKVPRPVADKADPAAREAWKQGG